MTNLGLTSRAMQPLPAVLFSMTFRSYKLHPAFNASPRW